MYVAERVRSRALVYVYGWKYVRKQGMSNGWQRSVIMLSSSARFICSRHKNVAYSPPQNSYQHCATRLARWKYFVIARSLREIRWNWRTASKIQFRHIKAQNSCYLDILNLNVQNLWKNIKYHWCNKRTNIKLKRNSAKFEAVVNISVFSQRKIDLYIRASRIIVIW